MANNEQETNSHIVDELINQYRQLDKKSGASKFVPSEENLTIRSVVKLTDIERKQIINLFQRMIDKPLGDVQEIIDPSFICGVSIQSESYYFEVSGRQQLQKMKIALNKQF